MSNSNVFELKWGTPTPVKYNDSRYGRIDIGFRGTYQCTLNDVNLTPETIGAQISQYIQASLLDIIAQTDSGEYETTLRESIENQLEKRVIKKWNNPSVTINNVKLEEIILSDEAKALVAAAQTATANETKIVQTDEGAKDGQNKCPKCGSTDIATNINTGKLKCAYCRFEFEPEKVTGLEENISNLHGEILGSGAQDIVADTNDIMTFKCSSCGSEVVIDTSEATHARCHWCRSTLSVNQQIPNGAIPDVVLPFTVKKEDAKAEIEKFVGKRKFFANSKFKQEFTTDNIMGVYFPYMIVDVNAHSNLTGQGEHLVKRYYSGSGDDRKVYYDADLYDVEREFDVTIEGLTVESSADKLNKQASDKTTNVINAIMPFDIENSVKWDANYLKGFTSEKRDTNIEELRPLVDRQAKDIARFAANETLEHYDRGVAWSNESLSVKGQQWKAAYLPVWLYSYQEIKGDKKLLHYVAVNARTKETMGSVPINMGKLILMSILVEILSFFAMVNIEFDGNVIFLTLGFIFFFIMYSKYRNQAARHKHELETKKTMDNLRSVDNYVTRRTGLRNSRMTGANNTSVSGQGIGESLLNAIANQTGIGAEDNNKE